MGKLWEKMIYSHSLTMLPKFLPFNPIVLSLNLRVLSKHCGVLLSNFKVFRFKNMGRSRWIPALGRNGQPHCCPVKDE